MIKRISILAFLVLSSSIQISQAETNGPGNKAVLIIGAGGAYKSTIGNMLVTGSAVPSDDMPLPFATCKWGIGCGTRGVNAEYSPTLGHYVIDTVNLGIKDAAKIIVEGVKSLQAKHDFEVSAIILTFEGRLPFNVDHVIYGLGLNNVPLLVVSIESNWEDKDLSSWTNQEFRVQYSDRFIRVTETFAAKPCYRDQETFHRPYSCCVQSRETILAKVKSFLEDKKSPKEDL